MKLDKRTKDKIIELINKDTKYQRSQLCGNFEKDKPINWRIVGNKQLIKNINKAKCEVENER